VDKTVLIGVGVVAAVGLAVVLLTRSSPPEQTLIAAPDATTGQLRAGLPARGDNPGDTVAGIGEGIGRLLEGAGNLVVRVGERDAERARQARLDADAAEERALRRAELEARGRDALRGAERRG
jgi:hypothetical protein